MRFAVVVDSVVVNIIEASAPLPDCVMIEAADAQIGGTWTDQVFVPPPTPEPSRQQIEAAIQANLDAYAQSWGYNDIAGACTYVGDACAKFNAEALVLRAWRSETWQAVEQIDAQIAAGAIAYPATVQSALSMLPKRPVRPA